MFENFFSGAEKTPSIDVQVGVETTKEQVQNYLLKEMMPIEFVFTDNARLFLSDKGHYALEHKNAIEPADITAGGFVYVAAGKYLIKFYNRYEEVNAGLSSKVKNDILQTIKGFVEQK